MKRGVVPLAESVPVIFRRFRRHGRIAEARMTVHVVRTARLDVAPPGIVAIVKCLLRDGAEHGRWRRLGRNINRLRVRATCESKRQQQSCWSNPLLHGRTSSIDFLVVRRCSGATLFLVEHAFRKSVALGIIAARFGMSRKKKSHGKEVFLGWAHRRVDIVLTPPHLKTFGSVAGAHCFAR